MSFILLMGLPGIKTSSRLLAKEKGAAGLSGEREGDWEGEWPEGDDRAA